MACHRLQSINIDKRGLFTAIYGLNSTSEIYITNDMRIHNVREALYLYLKGEGYTVIFYDDKAFSYEESPLLEFFNYSTATKVAVPGIKKDFFIGKGPMRKSRKMDGTGSGNGGNRQPQPSHPSIREEVYGNQRRYIVNQSEGFFRDVFSYAERKATSKLAVIFVSPNTLRYDVRERDAILNKWQEMQNNFRRNNLGLRVIVLYDYSSASIFNKSIDSSGGEFFLQSPFKDMVLNDIGSDEDDSKAAPAKKSEKNKTVFFLGGPEKDEIEALLNRKRLLDKNGLPALFKRVSWNHIVLRLWQGMDNMNLISEYKECNRLNEIIDNMDTIRAEDKLDAMLGIDNIKMQFANYRQALAAHRMKSGSGRFRPHMALKGSPGTGKTTVAKLFGDILREDGLLPKGHFVKVTVGDLIAEYVGQTRVKTRCVCEQARGGVLFIDEAYGLMSGRGDGAQGSHGADFGAEAIEVLIQFMEDNDDSLVILAGYTEEIDNLIDKGNKGFARRFNELGHFVFEDYSPEVLYEISLGMIKVPVTDDFKSALKGIIRMKCAYKNRNFGNVGDMENMVNNITANYAMLNVSCPLDVCHIPYELRKLIDESCIDRNRMLKDFNKLVGQEQVKEIVDEIYTNVLADRKKLMRFDTPPTMPKLNFIFKGNPGTGKSTVARVIAGVLHNLGVFPGSGNDVRDYLTEISGSNMIGKTPADVKEMFDKNIGKVLFIDEAYELRRNSSVITEIVDNVELPEYKNKLSVIMAGYSNDMLRLINDNSGLQSRFKDIIFEDYSNEELYEILVRMIDASSGASIDKDECREVALRYFGSLLRDSNFGNARVAENLLQELIAKRNARYNQAPEELQNDEEYSRKILPCDFPVVKLQNVVQESEGSSETFDGVVDCSFASDDLRVKSGEDIYASVGLLESSGGNGTAFVISAAERLVITASHVVEKNTGFEFVLNMDSGVHKSKAHLLWNNCDVDMAILRVDSLPEGVKQFAIDTTASRTPATNLYIVAFPLGQRVSDRAILTSGTISNYEEGLVLRDVHGTVRKFNAIRTEAQATHGSSGGPVVLADTMKVVGVLHGGINENGFYMNIASDISQLIENEELSIKI